MALAGAVREVFAIFGVQVDPEGNLQKGHKDVGNLKVAFEGAVAALAGNALLGATRNLAQTLGTIQDVSNITGVATDDIQTLGFAFDMAGGSSQEMNAALITLQKTLRSTQGATGPQVEALGKLGIAVKDAAGRPRELNQILPEVFANFSQLKSGAEEAEVATALFGSRGLKLLPTLRRGAAGLESVRAQLDELGGPVPEKAIADADAMNTAFAKFDRSLFNLKATIGAEVFPQLEKLVVGISKGVGRVIEFARGTTLAQTGSLALGVAIAGPLMTALGPLLKPGLKFAAIFLAMDDALAFLQGKDSVIGAILNGFFGPEKTQGVRNWVNGVVSDFGEVLASGTSIFSALSNGWETMLLDMTIAIDEWVLGIGTKWNGLVDSLGLGDAFKVDDTTSALVNEEGLAERKARRDELQNEAFRQQNPQRAAELDELNARDRFARKRQADLIIAAAGPRADDSPAAPFFTPPPADGGLAAGLSEFRKEAILRQFGNRDGAAAPLFAPAAALSPAFAPLPAAQPQHVENHIDARTTVNATTNADPADIANAVAEKQKSSLRGAYETLTARSNATAR
jgi:hypothetical protein